MANGRLSVFLQSARKKGSRSSAAVRIPTVANSLDGFCSTRQSSPAQPEQTDHRPKAKAVIYIGKQKNMQFICRVAGSHHIHVGRERDRGVEGVVCVQVSLRSASRTSPSSERVCVFLWTAWCFFTLFLYIWFHEEEPTHEHRKASRSWPELICPNNAPTSVSDV